jgi:hypothetical protein
MGLPDGLKLLRISCISGRAALGGGWETGGLARLCQSVLGENQTYVLSTYESTGLLWAILNTSPEGGRANGCG